MGVSGHGTRFCLEGCGGGFRGAKRLPGQYTGREGLRTKAPGWHRGSTTNPRPGCAGHAQGRQMWGKVKEGTREGRLECLP